MSKYSRFELIAPCHFGLEAVLKREITDLGYEIAEVMDGRVTFYGDEQAICYGNVFLRTAERVLIQVGRFKATTFEELFQGIKNIPWEKFMHEPLFLKEDVYPFKLYEFEGRKFYSYNNIEKILKQWYGDNCLKK